jgi:hypothetical protein
MCPKQGRQVQKSYIVTEKSSGGCFTSLLREGSENSRGVAGALPFTRCLPHIVTIATIISPFTILITNLKALPQFVNNLFISPVYPKDN